MLKKLKNTLSQELPGSTAQRKMEPPLAFGRHSGPICSDHRPAAVIILLYPEEDGWHLPLILRQPHLTDHAGQISLPGGSLETGESTEQAALRELHEEINVAPEEVEVLGRLSDLYLFTTNYLITPWVGYCQNKPNFIKEENEVAQIFEIPLEHLLDEQHCVETTHQLGPTTFNTPAYHWQQHFIWGATAMILSEFLVAYASSVQ